MSIVCLQMGASRWPESTSNLPQQFLFPLENLQLKTPLGVLLLFGTLLSHIKGTLNPQRSKCFNSSADIPFPPFTFLFCWYLGSVPQSCPFLCHTHFTPPHLRNSCNYSSYSKETHVGMFPKIYKNHWPAPSLPLCCEVQIMGRGYHWEKWKLKEAAHMLGDNHPQSRQCRWRFNMGIDIKR